MKAIRIGKDKYRKYNFVDWLKECRWEIACSIMVLFNVVMAVLICTSF